MGFLWIRICAWIILSIISNVAFGAEIHDAAAAGNVADVKRLLDADRENINALDPQGATPLHGACLNGHLEAARLLVNAGARLNEKNARGFTPLMLAALKGYGDIVDLLMDNGADGTQSNPNYGGVVDIALLTACQQGQPPTIAQSLVKRGLPFDANRINAFGLSPLRLAIVFGNTAAATWLLDLGADVNLILPRDGRTALNDAVSRNRFELAALLLDKGADTNLPDNEDNTPLLFAAKSGDIAIVRNLLDHGADLTVRDKHYGRTPLHIAALKGYPGIVGQLLERGSDVDATDAQGKTPFAYATKYGHRSAAAILQAHRASASDPDKGRTASANEVTANPTDGEAVAWYLSNRGWAVKTVRHTLIFDNEEFDQIRPPEPSLVNGFIIPPEVAGDDVYALYTCFHADSGELGYLHIIEDSLPRVTYIHNRDDAWRGARNSIYLGPNEEKDLRGLQIRTFRTTSADYMPTLTYLATVDKLNLVYIGFPTDDLDAYRQAMDSLAAYARQIDIAFLPIAEQDQIDSSDLRIFMEKFRPRAVCLLDPDRREYMFQSVADKIASWGFDTEVFCAQNPGDHFLYSNHSR